MRIKIIGSSKIHGDMKDISLLIGKEYEAFKEGYENRLIITSTELGKIAVYPDEFEIIEKNIHSDDKNVNKEMDYIDILNILPNYNENNTSNKTEYIEDTEVKPNLYIDFDGTITDSITAFCKEYSYRYKFDEGYKKPIPEKVNKWDLIDECPLLQNGETEEIFGSYGFFKYLKLMPNAIEVLTELAEEFELTIVSIGSYNNISFKSKYIQENLPFIKNSILIVNEGCNMNKSIIRDGILIDDHENNLISSRAEIKICFGKSYPWNEHFKGLRCKDWLKVRELMLGLTESLEGDM